jgi:uncharacterized protein YdhG (YjbR/CyaY superfamily)
MNTSKDVNFERHYAKFPDLQHYALLKTALQVEELFPFATRAIAWGMPTYKIGEDYLCHIEGFKNHNSLFPSSGAISEIFAQELSKYEVSKGTIHFPQDKPFPKPLLKKLLLARLDQINGNYPKKNGQAVEYYKNGAIKAKGKFKGELLTGYWEWFRLDSSIMRSGTFKNGAQVGEWTTYDKSGEIVKVTKF